MGEIGLVFLVLFGIAAALVIAWLIAESRRKMWRAVAEQYHFKYYPDDPYNIPERYSDFALFGRGHSRRASNCLEGTYEQIPVLLFDYRYKTGSGDDETTHHLSALIARLDISTPYLVIRPETFFDKIGDFLGFDDIDFEFAEFNRQFHVKGPDKRFAYDICHSGMMDYLLKHCPHLTWEIAGGRLILYGLGTFDPKEVDFSLAAVRGFFCQIPPFLRKAQAP